MQQQVFDAKKIKESATLNKHLNNYLSAFEKLREWVDIGNWLQKIANLLKEHPSPEISEKITFAKRLAQCLNPVLPYGVHQQALRVYEQVFKNMQGDSEDRYNQDYMKLFCEDMAIYSVGLFPFFQHASSQVKPKFLEIITDYYLPLGLHLIPCLPGLIISVVPGLDDSNEEARKKVHALLDKLGEVVGRKYMIGAIWMALLRSPKCRNSGVKYLIKKIEKVKLPEDEEDDEEAYDSDESENEEKKQEQPKEEGEKKVEAETAPNENEKEVANKALPEKPVEKPIESANSAENFGEKTEEKPKKNAEEDELNIPGLFKKDQKDEELEDAMNTDKLKQDIILLRMNLFKEINDSGLNESSDSNNFPNKSTLVLNALISCLEDENGLVKRNTLDFMISHFKLNHNLFDENEKIILMEAILYLLIKKELSITRRAYTWMFGKPDPDNKYEITDRNKFVIPLLHEAIKRLFSRTPTNSYTATLPLKIMQNFYMEHEHLLELTIPTLSLPILRYIYKYESGYPFSADLFRSGERFMENIPSQFDLLLHSLSQTLSEEILRKADKNCHEIMSLLEFTFEKFVLNKDQEFELGLQKSFLRFIIRGILKSFTSLNAVEFTGFSFVVPAMSLLLKIFENLERLEDAPDGEESSILISEAGRKRDFETVLDYFNGTFKMVIDSLHKNESDVRVLNLFSISAKILVKIQKCYNERQFKDLPGWFDDLTRLFDSENPHIVMIIVQTIIDLLVEDSKKTPYLELKTLILAESHGTFNEKGEFVHGANYAKLSYEKLWSLLDYNFYQNQIIDLVVKFHPKYPNILSEVILKSLRNNSVSAQEFAIRRFATFWNLVVDHSRHNKSLAINCISTSGLFEMLDFLDHDNPLIRHSCRSWLIDAYPLFHLIIDPIMEVLLQSGSVWYTTEEGQCFYTKIYDTQLTNEAFKKMKAILISTSEMFIKYVSTIKISETVIQLKIHFSDSAIITDPNLNYLNLIVVLCLKYIEGQALESLGRKFYEENSSVNSSSCEFLELLLSNMPDKHSTQELSNMIIEPLLKMLEHEIDNQDYVMQVQLLNLIKVILFQTGFKDSPENKKLVGTVLSGSMFVPVLMSGLYTEIPYVRIQFINFISLCIPLLSEFLEPTELTNSIKSILVTYYEIIQILQKEETDEPHLGLADSNLYDSITGEQFSWNEKPQERFVTDNKQELQKRRTLVFNTKRTIQNAKDPLINQETVEIRMSTVLQEASKQKQGDQRKHEVKTTSPFSKRQQNKGEVLTLLDGVKTILNFFLKLKPVDEDWMKGDKNKNSGGIINYVFSFFKNVQEERERIALFQQYQDTCQSLITDIQDILDIYVYCWRNSKDFTKAIEFTGKGINRFTFEKFNEFNKVLGASLKKHLGQPNSTTLKGIILSVLKPLLIQFTNEMMEAFLKIWMRECSSSMDDISARGSYTLNSQIELLIMLNLTPEIFINALTRNSFMKEVIAFYANFANKKLNLNPNILNYKIAEIESKILFLLYIYLTYSFLENANPKRDTLSAFWNNMIKFIKLFALSKNPNTILWKLEIYLLLSRKYSPRDLLNEFRFKKELHDEINALLATASSICAKTLQLYFRDPKGILDAYSLVLPFPPIVYTAYCNYVEKFKNNYTAITEMEKQMFEGMFEGEAMLYLRYRIFTFQTLQRTALELLQNTYSPDRVDRVVIRTREFMDIILPIIDNRNVETQPFQEAATDMLYSLLDTARAILLKEMKKPILDVFTHNDFFKCSKISLKLWSKIIDWVVSYDKSDMFADYLLKLTSFSSFFSNKDNDTKHRIKSFERICFIIYSGDIDKYERQLGSLLEKISEVIKNTENTHPALLVLILFCFRILILRLSARALNNLFRTIWPMLLSLLIQIFRIDGKASKKDPNLILAALKLIELISFINLDEFFLHQWMFVFDYFGLKMEPEPSNKFLGKRANLTFSMTAFQFQPYLVNSLPECQKLSYVNKQLDSQKDYPRVKRNIILTQASVENEADIRSKALELCQYLISNNEFRTYVEQEQIESLIEGDFISLDDYIYRMN